MSSARNHAKRSRYSYQQAPLAQIRRNAFIRNEERKKTDGFFARLIARHGNKDGM